MHIPNGATARVSSRRAPREGSRAWIEPVVSKYAVAARELLENGEALAPSVLHARCNALLTQLRYGSHRRVRYREERRLLRALRARACHGQT